MIGRICFEKLRLTHDWSDLFRKLRLAHLEFGGIGGFLLLYKEGFFKGGGGADLIFLGSTMTCGALKDLALFLASSNIFKDVIDPDKFNLISPLSANSSIKSLSSSNELSSPRIPSLINFCISSKVAVAILTNF